MLCAKFGWNWLNGLGEENFNFVNVYLLYHYFLPLRREQGPSFEKKTWIPYTHECSVLSLVEISLVNLEKMEMWKVYDDNNQQQTYFNKLLRRAQKNP